MKSQVVYKNVILKVFFPLVAGEIARMILEPDSYPLSQMNSAPAVRDSGEIIPADWLSLAPGVAQ